MNLFRRLFSQPEPTKEPPAAIEPAVVSKEEPAPVREGPPTAPLPKPVEQIETAQLPPEPTRYRIADGVTRPLPQEPIYTPSGNEHIIFGQATDVGMVRTNNQDTALSFFTTTRSVDERPDFGLFIVADGMGGHHDGEKASAITARTFAAEITKALYLPLLAGNDEEDRAPISEILVEAVRKANSSVIANVPDGGTTLTAVTIIGDLAYVVHVGDSRIYLISRDGLEQVTRDHSLVQRLIELDQLTPEEAADHPQKNVLYRALGQSESLEVDTLTRRLPPHSCLLLCSDGLWNQVEENEILEIVRNNKNPQEACEQLVSLANARGGIDNVTTILLSIPG
jgi:PPM family protein phosphatase